MPNELFYVFYVPRSILRHLGEFGPYTRKTNIFLTEKVSMGIWVYKGRL